MVKSKGKSQKIRRRRIIGVKGAKEGVRVNKEYERKKVGKIMGSKEETGRIEMKKGILAESGAETRKR